MTWFFGETAPGRRKLGRSWCFFFVKGKSFQKLMRSVWAHLESETHLRLRLTSFYQSRFTVIRSRWNHQHSIFERLICMPEYKLGWEIEREKPSEGEGGERPCALSSWLTAPVVYSLFLPLLLVIAQSSCIHLTGRFTHNSTASVSIKEAPIKEV